MTMLDVVDNSSFKLQFLTCTWGYSEPIHIAIDLILLQKQGFLYFSLWPQTPLIYIVGVVSVIEQGNFHIMDNIEDFTVQCVV